MKTIKPKTSFNQNIYKLKISQIGIDYEEKGYKVSIEYPLKDRPSYTVDMIAVKKGKKEKKVIAFEFKLLDDLKRRKNNARILKQKADTIKGMLKSEFPGFEIISKLIILDLKPEKIEMNKFENIENILHLIIESNYLDILRNKEINFIKIENIENVEIKNISIGSDIIELEGIGLLIYWVTNEHDGKEFENLANPGFFNFKVVFDQRIISQELIVLDYVIFKDIEFQL